MRIFIDPRSTITYSTFYIKGLYGYIGKKECIFFVKIF